MIIQETQQLQNTPVKSRRGGGEGPRVYASSFYGGRIKEVSYQPRSQCLYPGQPGQGKGTGNEVGFLSRYVLGYGSK